MLSTELDYSQLLYREAHGIPIGRAPEVNLRNNHAQYIFTWYVDHDRGPSVGPAFHPPRVLANSTRYGLALATSIMFYMVAKKPSRDPSRRVRLNTKW